MDINWAWIVAGIIVILILAASLIFFTRETVGKKDDTVRRCCLALNKNLKKKRIQGKNIIKDANEKTRMTGNSGIERVNHRRPGSAKDNKTGELILPRLKSLDSYHDDSFFPYVDRYSDGEDMNEYETRIGNQGFLNPGMNLNSKSTTPNNKNGQIQNKRFVKINKTTTVDRKVFPLERWSDERKDGLNLSSDDDYVIDFKRMPTSKLFKSFE